MTDAPTTPRPGGRALLLAALVVALLVRLPGIFWGDDFPGGFRGHHVDEWTHLVHTEKLISPNSPHRWKPQAYPTGLAAHVAVPAIAVRAATGQLRDGPLPPERVLFRAGRAVSVAYGVLTVALVWLLTRRLFPSAPRTADLAAWFAALGGLHVSQSHFFVADVPALAWSLLAGHLLLADRDESGARPGRLAGAAFAVGAALGMKLAVQMVVPLAVVALLGGDRIRRCVTAIVYATAGFALVTALTFTSQDVWRCLAGDSMTPPDLLDWRDFPRLYGIELLPSVGAPALAAALAGAVLAVRTALRSDRRRVVDVAVCLLLPLAVYAVTALPKLAPFPRHLIPFFPAVWILAASAIAAIGRVPIRLAVAAGAVLWSAALVVDTERVYLRDPRTAAMEWIRTNVPAGRTVWWPAYGEQIEALGLVRLKFPEEGDPDVLVAEAYRVNHWLSGTGMRDSRPTDWRRVFSGLSAASLERWQAVFDGRTPLREAARFSEGYRMPEPRISDRLLGNRSRNYLSEVVIFTRP